MKKIVAISLALILVSTGVYINHSYHKWQDSYWVIEPPLLRQLQPKYKIIKKASENELSYSSESILEKDFKSWVRSHGDSGSSRYSSLKQIDTSNVKNLKPVWVYRAPGSLKHNQANPIVVNDTAFFPIGDNQLVAVHAVSGKEIWRRTFPFEPAKRGLVWWKGSLEHGPRLFFPAGKSLYAVDPKNGTPIQSFGSDGRVIDRLSLVAPAIVDNKIILPQMNPAGVSAYNVITGEKIWTKNLVEAPNKLPKYDFEPVLSGANPWAGFAVDEVRKVAYITTGDAQPDIVGTLRPGNNERANSLIAIELNSGKTLWSFQEIAHDLWDLDIAASPILTQIKRNNRLVDVVLAVTKIGNTILLDRDSGKPIFDYHLRRAPRSLIPGEKTALYQPELKLPEPYSKLTFEKSDLTNIGKSNRDFALEHLEKSVYGFFEPPNPNKELIYFGQRGGSEWSGATVDHETATLYVASNDIAWRIKLINNFGLIESAEISPARTSYVTNCSSCHGTKREGRGYTPSLVGLSQWMTEDKFKEFLKKPYKSMPSFAHLSIDEKKSIYSYMKTQDNKMGELAESGDNKNKYSYRPTGAMKFLDNQGLPANKPPWGWLNALNLNTGKIKWRIPYGDDPRMLARGIKNAGSENIGAPVVTAGGLVFSSGTPDKKIRAYDKHSGKELWSYQLPAVGTGAPSVYEVDGKQYILVPATGGGLFGGELSNHFIAFSL